MCRYAVGIGSKKPDFECATRRLRQSADQEDPKAQLALFEIYDRGLEGAPDPAEAKKWANAYFNNPIIANQRIEKLNEQERIKFMRELILKGLGFGDDLIRLRIKQSAP
jgi:hypothetical protein